METSSIQNQGVSQGTPSVTSSTTTSDQQSVSTIIINNHIDKHYHHHYRHRRLVFMIDHKHEPLPIVTLLSWISIG